MKMVFHITIRDYNPRYNKKVNKAYDKFIRTLCKTYGEDKVSNLSTLFTEVLKKNEESN